MPSSPLLLTPQHLMALLVSVTQPKNGPTDTRDTSAPKTMSEVENGHPTPSCAQILAIHENVNVARERVVDVRPVRRDRPVPPHHHFLGAKHVVELDHRPTPLGGISVSALPASFSLPSILLRPTLPRRRAAWIIHSGDRDIGRDRMRPGRQADPVRVP